MPFRFQMGIEFALASSEKTARVAREYDMIPGAVRHQAGARGKDVLTDWHLGRVQGSEGEGRERTSRPSLPVDLYRRIHEAGKLGRNPYRGALTRLLCSKNVSQVSWRVECITALSTSRFLFILEAGYTASLEELLGC